MPGSIATDIDDEDVELPEQTTADEPVDFEYEIGSKRDPGLPRLTFAIKDPDSGEREIFTLVKPKMSLATGMIDLIENRATQDLADFGMKMNQILWGFVGYVEIEERRKGDLRLRGRARLIQRLNDPDDDMDIMDLADIFRDLVNKMFDRPTTPSAASLAKQSKPGRASGAATRGRRAKTSGK